MDMYPTTLAAMGVKIEGDKLALGVNLFSGKKTLLEQLGKTELNSELVRNSLYYMEKIMR
jgi:phosphoglycerol transferase